jgi:hypothetical protein
MIIYLLINEFYTIAYNLIGNVSNLCSYKKSTRFYNLLCCFPLEIEFLLILWSAPISRVSLKIRELMGGKRKGKGW